MLFVNDVAERLAVQEALQVVDEDIDKALSQGRGSTGVMPGKDDIIHIPQRRILRQGLFGEHIEPGSSQFAILQGCDQCCLVDGPAPPHIDEDGGLLHGIFIIDDVVGIYDTLRDDPISLGGIVFDWSD